MITRRGAGGAAEGGAEISPASGAGAAVPASAELAACAAATTGPGTAGIAAGVDVCCGVAAGGLTATTGPAAETCLPSVAAPGLAAAVPAGGLATTGPDGARDAIAGVCGGAAVTAPPARCTLDGGAAATIFGPCRGCGTIILGAGLTSAGARTPGVADAGAAGVAFTGAGLPEAEPAETSPARAALVGAALAVATLPAGFDVTAETGRAAIATAGVAGLGGADSCCRLSRIAFAASPGFDTRDQSIFGFASASCRAAPLLFPPRAFRICARTRSASSTSMELECVFFSVTPTSVRASRIALLFTSSSRANSLMRTVLIRPRCCFRLPLSSVLHENS